MEIANYLRNHLLINVKQQKEIILEETWTGKKQDVYHLKIFGSITSIVIPKEKRPKSDTHKNWRGIFIGYSQDITKHI